MPLVTYTFTCAYAPCSKHVVRRQSDQHDTPRYCSVPCLAADRLGKASWRRYHFTPEMDQAITRAAAGPVGSIHALWRDDPRFARAGISYDAVYRRVTTLGALRGRASRTPWSDDESTFAVRLYRQGASFEAIARKMRQKGWKRTPGAVKSRIWVLRIHKSDIEWYTPDSLQACFGVSDDTIRRWIVRHGLPVHHTNGGDARLVQYITPSALRAWVLDNTGLIASSARPDILWYTALLCPQSGGDTKDHATDDDSGAWLNGEAVRDVAAAD